MNSTAIAPTPPGTGVLATAPLDLGVLTTPRIFHQLCIILPDGSGSMTDPTPDMITKGEATDLAIRELITRFKGGSAKNCFSFSVVTFDTVAKIRLQPTELVQIDEFTEDFNPLRGHGGGTDIGSALLEAERVANNFFSQAPAGGVPPSAVFLVMSDGGHNSGPDVKTIADRIKASNGGRITICAALFASVGAPDPVGEAVLKSIVNDPVKGYSTVYRPEALRDFFKASLARASGVQVR
jgi:Mg-chelatase subunit ChlD